MSVHTSWRRSRFSHLAADRAAVTPSPSAVMSWSGEFDLITPAAKTPGTLDSSDGSTIHAAVFVELHRIPEWRCMWHETHAYEEPCGFKTVRAGSRSTAHDNAFHGTAPLDRFDHLVVPEINISSLLQFPLQYVHRSQPASAVNDPYASTNVAQIQGGFNRVVTPAHDDYVGSGKERSIADGAIRHSSTLEFSFARNL